MARREDLEDSRAMNETNSDAASGPEIKHDERFTQEDVARVAKQIWEDEGRPEGKSEEHWERAEEHLRGDRAKSETRGRAPRDRAGAVDGADGALLQDGRALGVALAGRPGIAGIS